MSAPTLTLGAVAKLGPCSSGLSRAQARLPARKRLTVADASAAGISMEDLLWVIGRSAEKDPEIARRIRLWQTDVAARVVHLFEAARPGDLRPREVIQVSRLFAEGRASSEELSAAAGSAGSAGSAAWSAGSASACAAAQAAAWSAESAGSAWSAAAWSAESAGSAWSAAAQAAAWSAESAGSAGSAARSAEERWQFDRLVLWFSDECPEPYPLPDLARAEA